MKKTTMEDLKNAMIASRDKCIAAEKEREDQLAEIEVFFDKLNAPTMEG